jgi:hypothetical protein
MKRSTHGPLRSHFFLTIPLLAAAVLCTALPLAAQEQQNKPTGMAAQPAQMQPGAVGPTAPKTLSLGSLGNVSYPTQWDEVKEKFSNAHLLVRLPQSSSPPSSPSPEQAAPPPAANGPLATILITTEHRTSADDAAKRLTELAFTRAANVSFYAISGWPAVEMQFTQKMPRRGAAQEKNEVPVQPQMPRTTEQLQRSTEQESSEPQTGFFTPAPTVQRAIIAVAVDNDMLTFEAMLAPDTPKQVLDEALAIAKGYKASKQESAADLNKTLEELKQAYQNKTQPVPAPKQEKPSGQGSLEGKLGTSQVQNGGVGELEIATSADGTKIVIASNASLTHSTDGGNNFTGGTAPFGMNDPTLARGNANDFYLGQIAFPTGTPAQKGVSGCTNAVSRSIDNGSTFTLRGFSAACPLGPISSTPLCFPDQPHIAADSFTPGPGQVYAVWREFTSLNFSGSGPSTCNASSGGSVAPSLVCSQDNGANWTSAAALPGIDDFPRIAVGKDGKVYVVGVNGNSIILNRFTSCSNGLAADAGFPVTVSNTSGTVNCPVPGLDRCDDGNTLNSPTVAPDSQNASHLTVSYAEADGNGGERVVIMESNEAGATFPTQFVVSSPTTARRFMPWSCMAGGNTFVGWYDRAAANSAHNDLTDYLVGGDLLAGPKNLSNNPDPQCKLWPCAPRSQNDSESCSVQPELAGTCLNGSGKGSGNRCDFNHPNCPSGESCQTGGGCPKYGDYSGMACANEAVVAAWASATAPKGLPANTSGGISIFSQVFSILKTGPSTFDRVQFIIETGNDNAESSTELFATLSGQKHAFCLKPSTSLAPDGICPNGNGALDQTGRNTWDNWSTGTYNFALDTPQTSTAGFKTLSISSRQSGCSLSCDNWDLQRLVVTVSDSAGKLKPAELINVFNPRNSNNNDNCIARLKAPPNASTVTYMLNPASPGAAASNFGITPPGSCPQ